MSRAIKFALKAALAGIIVVVLVWLLAYSQRLYLKKAYPIKYSEYVEKYSAEFSVPEHLVYSVIKVESGFDRYADDAVFLITAGCLASGMG